MKQIIAIAVLALVGCQPSRDDVLADAARTQAEIIRQAEAKQTLRAFGGTIIGKDEGEWGGEIAFREPDGSVYTVIADNSHGIFAMPYGVVAITGLAHLGTNRGAVHLLSRAPDAHVTATPLLQLPGAPCDVAQEGNRITMRISIGYETLSDGTSRPDFRCYALQSSKDLVTYTCPTPQPDICFG
jgi:hypothetical protein